jgi:transcriptional regulator with XRE-family HTH domain
MDPQRLLGDPDMVFGQRLRDLREQAGLTQQQLADMMRVAGSKMHRSTIGKIEAGERVVSIGEAAQFADVLDLKLTDMLTAGHGRLVPAHLKVKSLEHRAAEYERQRDEAQILLDDTLAELKDARAELKELEAEQ